MKRQLAAMLAGLMLATPVLAYEGEMGYFGGISSGYKLPTATVLAAGKDKKPSKVVLPYKENIYLTGKAIPVTGTIEFRPYVIDKTKPIGSYTETYVVRAEDKETDSRMTRTISLDTHYIYDEATRQTTKTSEVKKWTEVVVVEGNTYQLVQGDSNFSKSMIEDHTPGVMYYRGDISYAAAYRNVSGEEDVPLVVNVDGPIYGYEHAYAKTETQKRNIHIDNGTESYYIEETPTYTTYKDLQYGANEPGAISFSGNYKEILRGEGSLLYNIEVGHPALYDDEKRGSLGTTDVPTLEQLTAVELGHLKGHPAETDIRKMYSMKIFSGNPTECSPNQVVTRGEYIEMLVRALKMPVPEIKEKKSGSSRKDNEEETIIFTDISKEDPFYPYALAAYNAGLIAGGRVNPGQYLTREEMIVMNIRAIGLERLGIATGGIYTPFVDDNLIGNWAKTAVYAASRIGIIEGSNGYLFPQKKVTYAEVAAFLNQYINYLRYELRQDYDEKIML